MIEKSHHEYVLVVVRVIILFFHETRSTFREKSTISLRSCDDMGTDNLDPIKEMKFVYMVRYSVFGI